jgi:hypothetical protein
MGACVIARVFDPIGDGPPAELKSWDERKVSFKTLEQNISGTWEGEEISETGEALGKINVKLTQEWTSDLTSDDFVPKWKMSPLVPPHLLKDYLISQDVLVMVMLTDATCKLTITPLAEVHFGRSTGETLQMRVLSVGTQTSHALLKRVGSTSPTAPDLANGKDYAETRALLRLLPRQVSPTWSARRKTDAELVFHALAALGI